MVDRQASGVRAEQQRGAATSERGLSEFIAGDAWFCAIGLVVGLLIGVAAWRWLRDLGWSVVLVVGLRHSLGLDLLVGRLPARTG